MRRLGAVLLTLGLLLGAARLFTGIVFLADEPTAQLVLKLRPAAWTEWPEARDGPHGPSLVLDSDEITLVYGEAYLGLMAAAPLLVPGLAAAGAGLLAFSRRRSGGQASR